MNTLLAPTDLWHRSTLALFHWPSSTGALPYAYGDRANKDGYLFIEHQLTIASVYSAKGYDAPVVFLLGADLFPYTKEGRAAFYVAATRAKYRLVITGLWRDRSLLVEAQALHALPPA